jgi:hypothetical protein
MREVVAGKKSLAFIHRHRNCNGPPPLLLPITTTLTITLLLPCCHWLRLRLRPRQGHGRYVDALAVEHLRQDTLTFQETHGRRPPQLGKAAQHFHLLVG